MLKAEQINLDDKNYEQLLKEAMEQLPLLNDSWTDYNPHDPGITILELLTWLTESQRYYLNQVTEKHKQKYLSLLGVTPKAVEPACLNTVFLPKDAVIKKGEQAVIDGMPFTLEEDTVLSSAEMTLAKELDGVPMRVYGFTPFGENPQTGDCFYMRFSKPLHKSFRFYVKILQQKGVRRNPMREGYSSLAELSFEIKHGGQWLKCDSEDKTYGFMQSGGILLKIKEQGCLIRCTLNKCDIDIPPMFAKIFPYYARLIQYNEVYGNSNTPLAERGYLVAALKKQNDGYTKVDSNLAELHIFADTPHREGEYPIEENQINLYTPPLNIIPKCFSLLVREEDGIYRQWREVGDLSCSPPHGRHYVLDSAKGIIYFGDNIHGKGGNSAIITSMRLTCGGVTVNNNHEFNVGAAAAYNPIESRTGSNPESVEDAFLRYNADSKKIDKAVTAADYAELVMQTYGLCIENVNVFSTEPGVINICVKPSGGKLNNTYISNIRRHIYGNRLPCTELHIVPPALWEFVCYMRITPEEWAKDKENEIKKYVSEYISSQEKIFGLKISLSEWAKEIELCPFVKRLEEISLKDRYGDTLPGRGEKILPPDGLLLVSDKEIIIGR